MSFSARIHALFRDPVSGLTHLVGAALGLLGLLYLVEETNPLHSTRHTAAAVVFGVSMILLYLSSAAYHLLHVAPETRLVLRRIDHALIFTLIAGSYTPYCLVTLKETWGPKLLIVIWGVAVFGLLLSIFWIQAPRWLTTALYLSMGWMIVFIYPTLKQFLDPNALTWLWIGGFSYSLGAIIYAIKWPNPYPPVFGFHEIWHLFVLGGSASHFVSVLIALKA